MFYLEVKFCFKCPPRRHSLILLGGYLKESLPVVLWVDAVVVVYACLKLFNMSFSSTDGTPKNNNGQDFYGWFLQCGNGNLSSALIEVFSDAIDNPATWFYNDSLVAKLFDKCSSEEIERRVILSPKNGEWIIKVKKFLRNKRILNKK